MTHKSDEYFYNVRRILEADGHPTFEMTIDMKKDQISLIDAMPDIRNKLSPIANLIALLEAGLIVGTVDMHSIVINELRQAKKSVEYLATIDKQLTISKPKLQRILTDYDIGKTFKTNIKDVVGVIVRKQPPDTSSQIFFVECSNGRNVSVREDGSSSIDIWINTEEEVVPPPELQVGWEYKNASGQWVSIESKDSHSTYPYNSKRHGCFTKDGKYSLAGITSEDLILSTGRPRLNRH